MFKQNVLVADDSDDMYQGVVRLLNRKGWDVLEATSGIEAIQTARRCRPTLTIPDLNLPGTDGLEVICQFHAKPALKDVLITAVTAYAFAAAVHLARNARCKSITAKSFQIDMLLNQITRYVPMRLLPSLM